MRRWKNVIYVFWWYDYDSLPQVFMGRRNVDDWFARYTAGWEQPRYPLPSVIGTVEYYEGECIINDCQEGWDPRRCYFVDATGRVFTDEPEDGIESPARR